MLFSFILKNTKLEANVLQSLYTFISSQLNVIQYNTNNMKLFTNEIYWDCLYYIINNIKPRTSFGINIIY